MGKTVNKEYQAACDFLYSFVDYERDPKWKYDNGHFNLDRVTGFLDALDNPHRHGWFVHIAGTNGKGSVAAMMANALKLAGLRTGLYTSPHLLSFRERIRIEGAVIPTEEVINGVDRIRSVIDRFTGLTFFDVWTALAFDYFARAGIDVSVIEVGMGGKLDTTNVIIPAVSLITSVSRDHCGKLGDTLEAIAGEKAGIIKPGVPVISAPQENSALRVIERKAAETGSTLTVVGRDVFFSMKDNALSYRGIRWNLDNIRIGLNGAVQGLNTAVALAGLERLALDKYPVTSAHALRGIETVQWPGRFQKVSSAPDVYLDGACNVEAMKEVGDFISQKNSREATVAVAALCRDKEVEKVLWLLGTFVSRIVLTEVKNPRAMPADEMKELVSDTVVTFIEPDNSRAIEQAQRLAGEDGTVIVTGSLYLVGDALKHFGFLDIDTI